MKASVTLFQKLRYLVLRCFASLFMLCLIVSSPGVALADNIVYDDAAAANPASLQIAPGAAGNGNAEDLFPGTNASPVAADNIVSVDYATGRPPRRVYGGLHTTDPATRNTVYMINRNIGNRIYAGYAIGTNDATSNDLNMTGGLVGDRIVGGHSINGNATANMVTMSGGEAARAFGGTTSGTGAATGNRVTISGGKLGAAPATDGWVFGGFTASGDVSGNTVTLSGATTRVNNIEGGESIDGDVYDNTVKLLSGMVSGDAGIRGGWSSIGAVFGNSVEISGGSARNIAGGLSGGSGGAKPVTRNSVVLSGGVVEDVRGGHSFSGNVTDNTVTVEPGAQISSFIMGGSGNGDDVTISGNVVNLSAGTAANSIYGGSAFKSATITNNRVSITGGVHAASIYGGRSDSTSGNTIKNNIISISGTPNLSAAALFGGGINGDYTTWQTDGNKLEVNGFVGDVKKIAYFQNYDFKLSGTLKSGDAVLTVADPVSIDRTTVMLGFAGASTALAAGDEFVLIDGSARGMNGTPVNAGTNINATLGNQTYTFVLSVSGDKLVANVASVNVNSNGNGGGGGGGGSTTVPVSGVTLNHAALSLIAGGTEDLNAIVTPSNATNKSVTWKSSDENVATVDRDGIVTAVGPGTCTITATSNNGKTDTCTVTVTDPVAPPAIVVTIDFSGLGLVDGVLPLKPDETVDLKVTATPSGTTFTAAGLPDGLTLTADGRLHGSVPAVGTYEVTITATAPDGTTRAERFVVEVTAEGVIVTPEGGSGGGCGAGFGALALLAALALAPKRRK